MTAHEHKLVHYWTTAYGDFRKDVWICWGCMGVFDKKEATEEIFRGHVA